jgi:hypothetical protein
METLYNEIFSGYRPCQLVKRQKKKNNVSRTISVLVLRVLMCLENQSGRYIYDVDWFSRHRG